MLTKFTFLVSFSLLHSFTFGQAITVAVVDFEGFGIPQTEAIALSNRLRNDFFRLESFKVIDRGMMEEIMREQDFQQTGCASNECLVRVGKLLGVQQMVGGSISRVGAMFTVSARLVGVETVEVLSVSDFDLRGEIEDLLTIGMGEVGGLFSYDGDGALILSIGFGSDKAWKAGLLHLAASPLLLFGM